MLRQYEYVRRKSNGALQHQEDLHNVGDGHCDDGRRDRE